MYVLHTCFWLMELLIYKKYEDKPDLLFVVFVAVYEND